MFRSRSSRILWIGWAILSLGLVPMLRAQLVTGDTIPSVTVHMVSDTTDAVREALSEK